MSSQRDLEHYQRLATLFVYPEKEALQEAIRGIEATLEARYPLLGGRLGDFASFVESRSRDELREHYLKTFDIQASCYLDIGYVLFGEDYRRGTFLVNLAEEHRRAGHDCGSELPDHLPNLLGLLPRMNDPCLADQLAYCLMIPALREMVKNFLDPENAYKQVLKLLTDIMETDFTGLAYEQFSILKKDKAAFLNSIHCGVGAVEDGLVALQKGR